MSTEERILVLHISVLGKPAIYADGVPVTALPHKAQALLYYLAVNKERQSRESLAGLLWGDKPDDRARSNFRLTIHKIKMMLGPIIEADRRWVRLTPSLSTADEFFDFLALAPNPSERFDIRARTGAGTVWWPLSRWLRSEPGDRI